MNRRFSFVSPCLNGLPYLTEAGVRAARTRDTVSGALHAARSSDVAGFVAPVRADIHHDACWLARLLAGAWRHAIGWPRPTATGSP